MFNTLLDLFKTKVPSHVIADSLYSTVIQNGELVGGPPKDSSGQRIFTDDEYQLLLLAYLWGILQIHKLNGVQILLALEHAKKRLGTKAELEIAQEGQRLLSECLAINRFFKESNMESADHFYFAKRLNREQKEVACGSFLHDHRELVKFIGAMMKKFKVVDSPDAPWNTDR